MNLYDRNFWERKYLDLWSIPHFMIGVVVAFFVLVTNFSIEIGLVSLLCITVIWEIFEHSFNIREFFSNRVVDVVLAFVGFVASVYVVSLIDLKGSSLETTFYVVVFLYVLINLIGWFGYRKRKKERE